MTELAGSHPIGSTAIAFVIAHEASLDCTATDSAP